MVVFMDDVSAILQKLRTTAGFMETASSPRSCEVSSPVPPRAQSTALIEQLIAWAGSDTRRWRRLHGALLRIYSPRWESVDARDDLVAWIAAWVALTGAEKDLAKAKAVRPPLTTVERNNKSARLADVNFWSRLTYRLQALAAAALQSDEDAARILTAVVCAKGDEE